MNEINADKVDEAKKRERTTIAFTGDEIIEALYPLISARLKSKFNGQTDINITQTVWTQRPVRNSSKPVPPGYERMTTDVMFTLEWDAIEEKGP